MDSQGQDRGIRESALVNRLAWAASHVMLLVNLKLLADFFGLAKWLGKS
jgi:hypothetical protein